MNKYAYKQIKHNITLIDYAWYSTRQNCIYTRDKEFTAVTLVSSETY